MEDLSAYVKAERRFCFPDQPQPTRYDASSLEPVPNPDASSVMVYCVRPTIPAGFKFLLDDSRQLHALGSARHHVQGFVGSCLKRFERRCCVLRLLRHAVTSLSSSVATCLQELTEGSFVVGGVSSEHEDWSSECKHTEAELTLGLPSLSGFQIERV